MVSYRAIAKDAKLASAKNTVMAVLDNARGLAIKNNDIVVVVFRPRLDGNKQYVEAILAKWTRQSIPYYVNFGNPPTVQAIDRYLVIPGVPTRRLPDGIGIAGPAYESSFDSNWITNSYLPNINAVGAGEAPGSIIGVMYAPDGRNILYNSKSDAQRIWVDFNNDGYQQLLGSPPIDYSIYTYASPLNPNDPNYTNTFNHYFDASEPCVSPVPFLTIFNDDQVREQYDVSQWNNSTQPTNYIANRTRDYSDYLNKYADRIHFNRYTGVVMK
jgi:hypothetical protein